MIKIYHLPQTRSVRPIWLAYELGIEIEIYNVQAEPSETHPDLSDWQAASPAGLVPAMTDGDAAMAESGAMVEFILDRYGEGRLRPQPGSAESARYLQWCWFSEATLSRPLGFNFILSSARSGDAETIGVEAERKVLAALKAVDSAVVDRDFLLSSGFSGADIMMGYSLVVLEYQKVLDHQYPSAFAYVQRLKAREAFKKAIRA